MVDNIYGAVRDTEAETVAEQLAGAVGEHSGEDIEGNEDVEDEVGEGSEV